MNTYAFTCDLVSPHTGEIVTYCRSAQVTQRDEKTARAMISRQFSNIVTNLTLVSVTEAPPPAPDIGADYDRNTASIRNRMRGAGNE